MRAPADDTPQDSVQHPDADSHPVRWWLHGLLFFLTCGTTFFAGGFFSPTPQEPFSVATGIMFSASIMGILLIHEMGHFLAARHHRVDASLPYFIPFPLPPIGTFGAIIRMRKPPRTRVSLLDIGYAGPLAGLVVAAAVCLVGLGLSDVRPLTELPEGAWMEGNSILYLALKKIAHPGMGPGHDVYLHPLAWAGWLGLLVTSLNMLPAGQLDGGHILYAIAGPVVHAKVARTTHTLVLVLGLAGLACNLALLADPVVDWLRQANLDRVVLRGTGMTAWLVWAVLLRFVGGRHPPVEERGPALSRGRVVLGVLALVVFVLTFTPVFGSLIDT